MTIFLFDVLTKKSYYGKQWNALTDMFFFMLNDFYTCTTDKNFVHGFFLKQTCLFITCQVKTCTHLIHNMDSENTNIIFLQSFAE